MPALTDARLAIWDAVKNWPALQSSGVSVFKRFYEFKGDDSPEVDPHPDQLPALLVDRTPGGSVEQVKNRVWQYSVGFMFLTWTTSWNLANPELYEIELIKALFQSKANGVPYIQDATGFLPHNDFGVKHTRVKIDDTKIIEMEMQFRLRVRFDALG